jgi:hypothetical protein
MNAKNVKRDSKFCRRLKMIALKYTAQNVVVLDLRRSFPLFQGNLPKPLLVHQGIPEASVREGRELFHKKINDDSFHLVLGEFGIKEIQFRV